MSVSRAVVTNEHRGAAPEEGLSLNLSAPWACGLDTLVCLCRQGDSPRVSVYLLFSLLQRYCHWTQGYLMTQNV